MQTLVFNTTTKTIKLYEVFDPDPDRMTTMMENISTVKVRENFYEVMQKDEFDKTYPVLRVPIFNTNMFIDK